MAPGGDLEPGDGGPVADVGGEGAVAGVAGEDGVGEGAALAGRCAGQVGEEDGPADVEAGVGDGGVLEVDEECVAVLVVAAMLPLKLYCNPSGNVPTMPELNESALDVVEGMGICWAVNPPADTL